MRIHYLLRLLFFWILFFLLYRVLFVLYHFDKLPEGNTANTMLAFFKGYRLDISTACYLLIFPYVCWSLQQFLKSRHLHTLNHGFNLLLIIVLSGLGIAGIRMYEEWETLLGYRAMVYLDHPGEVFSFVTGYSLLKIILAWAMYAGISVTLYWALVKNFSFARGKKWIRVSFILLFALALFPGIRGGFQLSPVNESFSWYSPFPINNHIATNNVWYLAHSFVERNPEKNPYEYFSDKEAQNMMDGLYKNNTPGPTIIRVQAAKPNIVLFILESWTADILESTGGEKGVTPFISSLSNDGLLFTHAYSSGFRTEQGLTSILSGIPSQPDHSIITIPGKAEKLASINRLLKKEKYSSSVYYGGDIEFANMKLYLLNTGFEKIIDKNNFSPEQMNSKWGAHDGFVLEKNLQGLKTEKPPFFSVILTLSSHEPFEVPVETPFKGKEESDKFRGAAWYTDQCLEQYMQQAKTEKWFPNTLFIFIADHGHRLPVKRDMNLPESRRITFFLYGDVLKPEWKGKTISAITSQHDVPAILLDQLDIDRTVFKWSKNTLNPSLAPFAYYSNENVLGWVDPGTQLAWSFVQQKDYLYNKSKPDSVYNQALKQAKAFLQLTYKEYLNY